MYEHEDSRRRLIEWAKGDFKVSKAVIAKCDCVVGDHYHRNKDEHFLLLTGRATIIVNEHEWKNREAPFEIDVPRGNYHRFELEQGSILLGVTTAVFDPDDEIKGYPPSEVNRV